MTDTDDTIPVTFHPQEWDDAGFGEQMALPADGRDPVTFEVPRKDATDEDGTLFEDDTYDSDALREHDAAPDWVKNWGGPFYVSLKR